MTISLLHHVTESGLRAAEKSAKILVFTGGGSCSMQILSAALGALYSISSPYCLSHVMNGVYYSIDTGVEPDYRIDRIENYYNREHLTEYINLLF